MNNNIHQPNIEYFNINLLNIIEDKVHNQVLDNISSILNFNFDINYHISK